MSSTTKSQRILNSFLIPQMAGHGCPMLVTLIWLSVGCSHGFNQTGHWQCIRTTDIHSIVLYECMKLPLTLSKNVQYSHTSLQVITTIKTINLYKEWNLLPAGFLNPFLTTKCLIHGSLGNKGLPHVINEYLKGRSSNSSITCSSKISMAWTESISSWASYSFLVKTEYKTTFRYEFHLTADILIKGTQTWI